MANAQESKACFERLDALRADAYRPEPRDFGASTNIEEAKNEFAAGLQGAAAIG